MQKILLSILLNLSMACSIAQKSCSIKKAYAFYTVSVPGMIRKDDNGNDVRPTPSVERIIYLECSGTKAPVFEAILYNNIILKATVTKTETATATITVGRKPNAEKDYILTAGKGNTIWKVLLQPTDERTRVAEGCKNIIIKSRTGSKVCRYNINKETELVGIPNY